MHQSDVVAGEPGATVAPSSAGSCYSGDTVSSLREDRGHGYPELKPLLDVYLAEVRDRLGTDVSAVALYGSVARGQAHAASDIDLFVVHRGERAAVFEVFLEVALQLRDHPLVAALQARDIPTEPYPVFRSEEELADTPWLLLDVCDHGIILFDTREVLARKLASLRLRLHELGSRRIELADGSWYWDLKPDLRPGEVIAL